MPGGVYFPARKIPKYWPRTCQGLNSVSLRAPKSHLSSFGICKQSVTPHLPGLTWHAFSEHTFQIRHHAKLSKKNGGESLWFSGQSTHAACVKWGSSPLSKGSLSVLQALVSVISVVEGTPALEDALWMGQSGGTHWAKWGEKKGRNQMQSAWIKMLVVDLLNQSESYPLSLCVPSERVSIGTNCTREGLLMQRQETGCVPTWTSQQTLSEVEGLCFSISSLFPSACFFLVLFFSTTAFVHYIKSFSSSRQSHQRPSDSSLEITHWP